mmetsp:Transcript_114111/g.254656  ORF Transcript_114111/g.254656 Transcript_114111/m.254656 type:complete len:237 (-) Transcript_114111:97-807(-)
MFMEKHQSECDIHLCGGHRPIGSGCEKLEEHSGNFVALFRQPEQRLISGFYANRHDYRYKNASISEYKHVIAGCAVRMMLGMSCGSRPTYVLPKVVNENDADKAIKVLAKEFAFVGLTEEFDLSVCLFHKMYGGSCHAREFLNTRPGDNRSAQEYDVDMLDGFKDEVDGKLYASAKNIFWQNVKVYDVHRQSCIKVCEAFPDPFLTPIELQAGMMFATRPGTVEYDWAGRWAFNED